MFCAVGATLIHVKQSLSALEGLGTLIEHESRIALKVGVIARLTEEQNHDQVDCCCWLRLIDCNVGPSPDPRTVS
jgi:hypothetical protein